MTKQVLRQFLAEHWGKVIGGLLGLVVGLAIILFGFWRTLFIFFCIALGTYAGKLFDRNERLQGLLNRFWPDSD